MVFSEKIAQTLGVKLDVVDDLFDVEEDKTGYFVAKLKPKQFLDKMQFRSLCSLARDLGGEGYIEGAKAWKVPGPMAKVPQGSATSVPTPVPTVLPKTSPTEVLDEDTEILKDSSKKIGHLYPVLTDSFGNVIDGFHRLKADPNWPKFKVDRVSDPVQLTIARLIANTRRDVPPEEKKEGLSQLIKMTGWGPKQLAENLGWALRTVYLYLPEEAKGAEPEELARARLARGMEKNESVASLKPQDLSEGQIREIIASPRGQEVLASVQSETSPTLVSKTNEIEEEPELNATEEPEETSKTSTEKQPEPSRNARKAEQIDTGFEWVCPECQQKFQLIHVKKVDGKIDHRLEAKY